MGVATRTWVSRISRGRRLSAHLVDHAPPGLLDEVLVARGGVLARLGPGLAHLGDGSAGGSADPETARYLLFGAVLRVLQAAGENHPVVLVIDDLQWADAPSLQLLRYLVAWDEPLPVLVVATFREVRDRRRSPAGRAVGLVAPRAGRDADRACADSATTSFWR